MAQTYSLPCARASAGCPKTSSNHICIGSGLERTGEQYETSECRECRAGVIELLGSFL